MALSPPSIVADRIGDLTLVDRFSSLPQGIQAGRFTVDGASADGWQMAEPGAVWNATDVPVSPSAPGRRLIFAGCDSQLCVIHYERGGVAHFYEILALERSPKGWTAVWNARGAKPLANLDALRMLVRDPASARAWNDRWVKGDF